jgi:Ser/Thr protein kinase RdoA (MazF antagonist)
VGGGFSLAEYSEERHTVRIAPSRRQGLASDAEVLDRVNRVLGPVEVADDLTASPLVARVLRVNTRSDEFSIVKWYSAVSDYQRELDALTSYTPALGSDAPKLIDHDDVFQMLLLSEVHGEPAIASDAAWDPVIHYRAGVLIRRLHESAPPVSSDQFARQCAARFEDAAAELDGVIDSHLLSEARLLIARAMDIEAHSLVPTHRDNHPRNWMVDPGGHVRLIDFANAEYDPWIVDVLLLEQDYWRSNPSLKVAFLSGYDRDITAEDEIMLRAHQAVVAVRLVAASKGASASKTEKARARDMFDRLLGVTLF